VQDKSFEDALRELKDRLAEEIQEHVRSRLKRLPGNTVSSLVTDIEAPQMRASVADILCMVKVTSLLHSLTSMDLLTEAERQEMKNYIDQLHEHSRQSNQQTS
jgi:hypothetical protein